MGQHFEAVYEDGVFRPLEPVAVPEHQKVRLTIEDKPAPVSRDVPLEEGQEEITWLAKHWADYVGEWVALVGPRMVAHGTKLADVRAAAEQAGFPDPLFASVEDRSIPFGGW